MDFRFSGHESFPCRYTWLPKAYNALKEDPFIFKDEDSAMVQLGVGKNMVRAIRFWVQLMGVAKLSSDKQGYILTPLGNAILDENGLDPYLEDIRTLWLLHWKMSSHVEEPMFAWHFLLNKWHSPELTRTEVIRAFQAEAQKQERPLSKVTLEQHFDVFLHTYVPTRGRKGEVLEDNLDCPLTELRLLIPIGERTAGDSGRRETIYAYRRDHKVDITGELLAYCIYDYWRLNRLNEATLSFRDITVLPGSVGQIFKFSENDLRERLENIFKDSLGLLDYQASSALPRVFKHYDHKDEDVEAKMLANIYI
jgi:hypothetical protein